MSYICTLFLMVLNKNKVRLSEVEENKHVVITKVLGHGSFRRRISEMGFVAGKEVTCLKNAPLFDPVEYQILGYNVSLRRAEADLIEVITMEEAMNTVAPSFDGVIDMEVLKISAREKGKTIQVALVGNPNCGKTTLFNRVTTQKSMLEIIPGLQSILKSPRSFTKGIPLILLICREPIH